MGRRRLALFALLAVFATVAVVAASGESHRTSVRYLAWRYFAVGSWEYGVRFLNADVAFRQSFDGKRRDYLRRWFPDLRAGNSRPLVCSDNSAFGQVQGDGEWIGDTPWLILYQGNAVKEIRLVKGC